MDPEAQKQQRGDRDLSTPLLRSRNDSQQVYQSVYDRPLPCCGCGIGWFSFLAGFLLPLTWFFGTYLFMTDHYRRDIRERPGLAACAIAALVTTVAAVLTVIALMAQQTGLTFSGT